METLVAQAERYLAKMAKTWVTDILSLTIYDDGYSEVEIYRDRKNLKALVNVGLSALRHPSLIETNDTIYQPLTLISRQHGNAASDRVTTSAVTDLNQLPSPDGHLEYIVGYDSTAQTGTASDYETLEALLEHYQTTGELNE